METKTESLPNIRPSSDLRTKYTEVMNEVYKSDKPVFLTKKGRCDTVIMSADTFSKYEMTVNESFNRYLKIKDKNKSKGLRCCFCGKYQNDVKILIAGPKEIYICNECVNLSHELIFT